MKKYQKIIYLLIALITLSQTYIYGQERNIYSYQQVLNKGIENNFNIKLGRYSLDASKGETITAIGYTNPYLNFSLNSNNGPDPTLTFSDSKTFNASFIIPTRYGINYSTGLTLTRIAQLETPSPNMLVNNSGIWLGANISLLRGLGHYNTVNTNILSVNKYYAAKQASFSDEVLRYVRDITITYIQLQKDLSIYKLRQADLEEANRYQKDIEKMILLNEIAAVEISRAKSLALDYQQKKTDSENNVLNSLNNLNQLLGQQTGVFNEIPVLNDTIPDPILQQPSKQLIDSVLGRAEELVKRSMYYKSLSEGTSGAEIEMKGAENLKRHDLNLEMRYNKYGATFNQPTNRFFETLKSTFPGHSFNVTLSYKLPFQNQIARGNYITKRANYELQLTQTEKTKFEAVNRIRILLNNIKNMHDLLKYAKQYALIQNKTYKDEIKKFKLGAANQLDIISTYETYSDSRVNAFELIYDIYDASIQLKYLIGDLPNGQAELEKINIEKLSKISIPEY